MNNNYEQKDNQGALFANKKKQTDMQPDFTGSAMIDGKMKDVSLWFKKSKAGMEYFSIAFRDKQINNIP